MTRRFLVPLLAATSLAAVAVAVPACKKADAKAAAAGTPRTAATVPVSLAAARLLPVTRTVEVVGTLYGEEETVVSAKVPGRIITLYKDVGDAVAPGEPLVQLKPNDYQLAVNKAELAMKEALAKLGLTELPAPDFDVTGIPTVVRAKLQADNAQARFNRGKKLFEAQPTKLITEEQFTDLQTAVKVAQSEYEVELLNARSLVASAQALKGDLDIAAQRLNDATTRAPSAPEPTTQPSAAPAAAVAGLNNTREYVVVARYVNVGELVREITPAFKLIDDNPIKLKAMVPERHVAEVKVGQRAKVRVEAYPGVDFAGVISRVNPQVEITNRTFSVEILIGNDDHRLRSGAFARAAIETVVQSNVVFVPEQALVSFAGVNKVFTVKDDKAVEITVDPGNARTPDNRIEIAKGLKGGEQVVTRNASKLATGTPVTIQAPPATAPESEAGAGR